MMPWRDSAPVDGGSADRERSHVSGLAVEPVPLFDFENKKQSPISAKMPCTEPSSDFSMELGWDFSSNFVLLFRTNFICRPRKLKSISGFEFRTEIVVVHFGNT
jgi:hypothetical protein